LAIAQLFKVATEFRFEIGSALIGASNLEKGVNQVSQAADNALLSFKRLGVGAAVNLSVGSASILGAMGRAIEASERFKSSQIDLSNIIAANRDRLTGPVDDFTSRMEVSRQVLQSLAADARKFSLPQGPFVETTKLLAAQLTSKGLAGSNFQNAIDLSRNFLKSAPTLGVDAGLAQGQLLRAIEGRATRGDTLFNRLAGETQAFKEFAGSAKKFNQLKPDQRLKLLISAMEEFTSQTDEVTARAGLLSNKLRVLRDTFSGLDGILLPLGDVIKGPVLQVITEFTNVADGPLRQVFMNLAEIAKPLAEDFRQVYVNLVQLSAAARDFQRATVALGILGIAAFIPKLLILRTAFKFVIAPLAGFIGSIFKAIPLMTVLGVVFKGLVFVVTKLFAPFFALFTLFQTISRAVAIAQLKDAERLPQLLADFTGLFARFQVAIGNIFSPFTRVIDAIARFISPLFQYTFLLEKSVGPLTAIVQVFENLGRVVLLAQAGLQGIFFAIFQFVENIRSGKIFDLTQGVSDAFNGGIDDFITRNRQALDSGDGVVSNQVTNIGKVEIRNQFRENLQPDRIAFSLKEQLLKTAQAPTTARGRSFNRSATSGAF
jgi:hypothetical protein